MPASTFYFHTTDGHKIHTKKWIEGKSPKAIVQIAHGMAEHIERYNAFANELLKHDIYVYGNDHRGHGQTSGTPRYFSEENGFEKVVNDMYELTNLIREEQGNVSIFLFGHSMGSFLARRYIQLYGNEIRGVLLSGTGGNPGILGKIGRTIAKWECKRNGRTSPSPLLDKLTFGNFNKQFQPARTQFEWLTRNDAEVDKYIEDSLCGGIFTAGFFHDLLTGLKIINKKKNIQLVPSALPIYIFSGSQDPVGNNTKGVQQVCNTFQRAGVTNITFKLYEGGRHEMLNEINQEEVYTDIINWIKAQLR
ncbi:alpha/beta hydrolase [Bacillus sp. 165]|uniref:alpha/beta hydrolase n=1 Tax=Bacillus sp. 165 TaxID=1529117 RepID=UPI001FFE03F4|nr:alpha/beta hydrolase [Bacillus sp. 165]